MSRLHIRLLDVFDMTYDDGSLLTITSARQRELLVYLLLRRRTPQPRRQIAFLFWPDTSEKQAQRNLRAQLSRLRSQWPGLDRWLEIGNETLQWRPDAPFTLDVAEFEQELTRARAAHKAGSTTEEQNALHAAIEHYRGPLFPGVFDDWVLSERERLEQHYLLALERLIVLLEEQRNYAEAIAAAQRLLRQDPLREVTYRQLIRLYTVSGDRPQALRTYHTCVTVLSHELGVEPDIETESLYQRLVGSEEEDGRDHQTTQRVRQDTLVGRGPEWQRMLAVWRQVLAGGRHFLLISGEAGIGKSRLAQELFEWTRRQGVATARTRAYAAAGSLAYTPVIEWLRSDGLRPTLQHLDAVWLVEVARLLPELMAEHPDLPEPVPLMDNWQRRRLFEGLARACIVDAQPRLLLLDDLQWCDEETLAWLRFFMRYEPDTRVLFVGTLRPEEVGGNHPLHEWLSDLRSEGRLTEVKLSPFSLEECVKLAEQVLDHTLDSSLHKRLFAETAGNPLFVVETVKAGLAGRTADSGGEGGPSLPPKIYAVIRSRLARLSEPARALVILAATVGRSFTFSVLSAVGSYDEDVLVDILDELWHQGIILEHGVDAYDFSHDRIRDVAYAEISPVRRPHFHRHVARALEQIHAHNLDGVAAQLAAHWSAGGNRERAIDYYEQAAAVALDRLALSAVVSLLTACLALLDELPQTPEIQQRKLAVLLELYDPLRSTKGWASPVMLPYCLRTLELCQAVGTRRQLSQATHATISYHVMHGQQLAAYDYALQCLALAHEFPGGPSVNEQSVAHASAGGVLLRLGRLADAQEHFALARPVPAHVRGPWEALVLWLRGYPDQARRKLAGEFDLITADIPPFPRARNLLILLEVCYCLRQQETLCELTESLLEVSEQYEMSFWQAASALFQGWSWVEAGQHQAGLARMVHGIKGMEQAGAGLFTLFLSMLVAAYARTGHLADAMTTLKRAIDYADAGGEHFWYAELQRQMGDLLQAQGRPAQAVESWYQLALETARGQDARSLELRAAVGLCTLWVSQGRTRAACDLLVPLYDSFSEGFDTADLIEARELLAQIA